jgi:hypothetical protein
MMRRKVDKQKVRDILAEKSRKKFESVTPEIREYVKTTLKDYMADSNKVEEAIFNNKKGLDYINHISDIREFLIPDSVLGRFSLFFRERAKQGVYNPERYVDISVIEMFPEVFLKELEISNLEGKQQELKSLEEKLEILKEKLKNKPAPKIFLPTHKVEHKEYDEELQDLKVQLADKMKQLTFKIKQSEEQIKKLTQNIQIEKNLDDPNSKQRIKNYEQEIVELLDMQDLNKQYKKIDKLEKDLQKINRELKTNQFQKYKLFKTKESKKGLYQRNKKLIDARKGIQYQLNRLQFFKELKDLNDKIRDMEGPASESESESESENVEEEEQESDDEFEQAQMPTDDSDSESEEESDPEFEEQEPGNEDELQQRTNTEIILDIEKTKQQIEKLKNDIRVIIDKSSIHSDVVKYLEAQRKEFLKEIENVLNRTASRRNQTKQIIFGDISGSSLQDVCYNSWWSQPLAKTVIIKDSGNYYCLDVSKIESNRNPFTGNTISKKVMDKINKLKNTAGSYGAELKNIQEIKMKLEKLQSTLSNVTLNDEQRFDIIYENKNIIPMIYMKQIDESENIQTAKKIIQQMLDELKSIVKDVALDKEQNETSIRQGLEYEQLDQPEGLDYIDKGDNENDSDVDADMPIGSGMTNEDTENEMENENDNNDDNSNPLLQPNTVSRYVYDEYMMNLETIKEILEKQLEELPQRGDEITELLASVDNEINELIVCCVSIEGIKKMLLKRKEALKKQIVVTTSSEIVYGEGSPQILNDLLSAIEEEMEFIDHL